MKITYRVYSGVVCRYHACAVGRVDTMSAVPIFLSNYDKIMDLSDLVVVF